MIKNNTSYVIVAYNIFDLHINDDEKKRLFNFSCLRCGAYSRAALIRRRRLFNLLTATVRGKRKRKVGLVVVYSLHARTEECEDFEERTE